MVYIDLSWVVYEDYIKKDFESWVRLIRKYPESFMLGSDVVGGAENMGKELGRYQSLLDKISEDPKHEVRQNLARNNFVRLMQHLGERRRAKMGGEKLISDDTNESTGLVLKSAYEFDEKAHMSGPKRSFINENKP